MVGRWMYDLIYRRGAPWDTGPRSELVGLVEEGALSPGAHPRALDLGCGAGANAVYLAERGFEVTGVDFSRVALATARRRAAEKGVQVRFEEADLTHPNLLQGKSFDLLVDYGTLDDLSSHGREVLAGQVRRLTRPGGKFLLWCFYGPLASLPRFSFSGPSRAFPGLVPGEEMERFGRDFDIERITQPRGGAPFACFLMTRRG